MTPSVNGPRRRGRSRSLGVLCAVAGSVVLLVHGAVDVLADCGKVDVAEISGDWQMKVTYAGATGPPLFSASHVPGSSAVDALTFVSTCTGTGQCKLAIKPSPSDPLQFASSSGLLGPDPSSPLVQSGSTYTSDFPSSGFGGPGLPPCSPPPIVYHLTLTVLQAVPSPSASSGWSAAVVSGSETVPDNWSCPNGPSQRGTFSAVATYTLLGVPKGDTIPTSAVLPCGARTAVAPPAIALPPAPGAVQASSISSALATPQQSFGSVGHTVANVVIALAFVLFITFPAQLFNKTLEENYDDIRDIVSRRFGWARRLRRDVERESSGRTRLVTFAVVVLLGALLGSLNDPNFGFNGSSALLYLGVIASMITGLLVGTSAARFYRRLRHEDVTGRLHALPAGLLVALFCVILSRVTQFRPGYLYGVIFGVAFVKKLTRPREGLGIVVGVATTLALAVFAWFVWLPVHDRSVAADPGAGWVLVADYLAPLVVGGFVGSVLGLIPIHFMPGGTLFGWKRSVWGATFAVAFFGLLQVLLRPDQSPSHSGSAPVVTATVLFLVFGAVSVGFNLYFERRKKRRALAVSG
jgi:hypothetical protein